LGLTGEVVVAKFFTSPNQYHALHLPRLVEDIEAYQAFELLKRQNSKPEATSGRLRGEIRLCFNFQQAIGGFMPKKTSRAVWFA